MTELKQTCILCNHPNASYHDGGKEDCFYFSCPTCKKFKISSLLCHSDMDIKYKDKKYILSGIARHLIDNNMQMLDLHTENYQKLIDEGDNRIVMPASIEEKADAILKYIKYRTSYPSENVTINNINDASICFAKNHEELNYLLDFLKEMGYIKLTSGETNDQKYQLTVKGVDHLSSLEKINMNSNNCFIAMNFDNVYDDFYRKVIFPAVQAAKYKPIRIKESIEEDDSCEKIDDKIILEMKKARFMVADFTDQRQCVYYEAGFAEGMGIRVIRCCKQEDAKTLHFDTRNYIHLIWNQDESTWENFKNRLYQRIIVVIGEGNHIAEDA